MVNKRFVLIISGFCLLILLTVSLFLLINNSSTEIESTGGSGELPIGTLVLKGYETPSNDSSKIELGRFLSIDQQKTIQSSLEKILFEENPMKMYRGAIKQGTVDVDYQLSLLTFIVAIEEPNTEYKVTYNTITDEIRIFDTEGIEITTD